MPGQQSFMLSPEETLPAQQGYLCESPPEGYTPFPAGSHLCFPPKKLYLLSRDTFVNPHLKDTPLARPASLYDNTAIAPRSWHFENE